MNAMSGTKLLTLLFLWVLLTPLPNIQALAAEKPAKPANNRDALERAKVKLELAKIEADIARERARANLWRELPRNCRVRC
jgi:hypothetical protein